MVGDMTFDSGPTMTGPVSDTAEVTSSPVVDSSPARVTIEGVKGILMSTLHVDADEAFDLLAWCARSTSTEIGIVAEQLLLDFGQIEIPGRRSARDDVRTRCVNLLFTVSERIGVDVAETAFPQDV